MDATRVPPEVWLQIIRNASYVPPCNINNYDPLPRNESHNIHSGKILALIRDAISTKYAISLVCRLWSTIVVEFLYEFIIVRDAAHIPLLVDHLSRADTKISSKVQRIDFMCLAATRSICYHGMIYNAKELAHAAAKLIRLCPRLQALSSNSTLWEGGAWSISEYHTQPLVKALRQVENTLECLEWRSYWSSDVMVHMCSVTLPRLRLLIFSPEPSYHHVPYVEDLHSDYEHATSDEDLHSDYQHATSVEDLHADDISTENAVVDIEYNSQNWTTSSCQVPEHLSCLRHIVVSSDSAGFAFPYNWNSFLRVDTITFRDQGFRFFNEGSLPSTVHTIILHAKDFPIAPPRFPHIKRVGLMGTEVLAPEEYDYVFNLFVGERGLGEDHFPILDIIRFMDTSLSGILAKRASQFQLWERRCRSKGIRLEDEMGKLITPDRL